MQIDLIRMSISYVILQAPSVEVKQPSNILARLNIQSLSYIILRDSRSFLSRTNDNLYH